MIAEAGVNHNGDLTLAKQLIDVAADCGADVVKFQTFDADRLVVPDTPLAAYQQAVGNVNAKSARELLKSLELSANDHQVLKDYCDRRRITFLSTAFDIESLELLRRLGQPYFKIPSGEITNVPYLSRVGGFPGRIILSTGMSTLEEVSAALGVLERSGASRDRITVLHCTSDYPAAFTDVNLRAMRTIADKEDVSVGLSDHTPGIEISIAAVAMGASIIEKHFTIDRSLPGPDQQASLEPPELRALVQSIRNVESAFGDGTKRPVARELENRLLARKSIVAARPIRAGEPFTVDNLTTKRPATGLDATHWHHVLGRVARRAFAADEMIEL